MLYIAKKNQLSRHAKNGDLIRLSFSSSSDTNFKRFRFFIQNPFWMGQKSNKSLHSVYLSVTLLLRMLFCTFLFLITLTPSGLSTQCLSWTLCPELFSRKIHLYHSYHSTILKWWRLVKFSHHERKQEYAEHTKYIQCSLTPHEKG